MFEIFGQVIQNPRSIDFNIFNGLWFGSGFFQVNLHLFQMCTKWWQLKEVIGSTWVDHKFLGNE